MGTRDRNFQEGEWPKAPLLRMYFMEAGNTRIIMVPASFFFFFNFSQMSIFGWTWEASEYSLLKQLNDQLINFPQYTYISLFCYYIGNQREGRMIKSAACRKWCWEYTKDLESRNIISIVLLQNEKTCVNILRVILFLQYDDEKFNSSG